jgi:hypothetical protein
MRVVVAALEVPPPRNFLRHQLLVVSTDIKSLFNPCNIPDIKSMQNRNKMLEMAE